MKNERRDKEVASMTESEETRSEGNVFARLTTFTITTAASSHANVYKDSACASGRVIPLAILSRGVVYKTAEALCGCGHSFVAENIRYKSAHMRA